MIHPQLLQDSIVLGSFPLCHVLLMNEARYPWLILVPDRTEMREIYMLEAEDQVQLIKESSVVAEQLAMGFQAHKINIAALGNIVPQLHLHHIVRYTHDAAWPTPVWGKYPSLRYQSDQLIQTKDKMIALLKGRLMFKPVSV